MRKKTPPTFVLSILTVTLLLTACQTKETEVTRVVLEQETVMQTVVETVMQLETVVVTATAAPDPEGEPTLVICTAAEPATLYPLDPSISTHQQKVLAAIYDGPYETRGYGYQPVIMEKMPSLADGDVVFETVTVQAGDLVVDDGVDPVALEEGVVARPAGCYSADCAVTFDGAPLEMEQMVVTFKLKPGITWSDGTPLTARDSVYGLALRGDPDTPAPKWVSERIASYEAIDDYTIVWTGLPGFRDFDFESFFFDPMPEHVWGGLTALELIEAEASSRVPLGWGPYVIEEWVQGDHISLRRNERYWRAGEGLPKFDRLVYRFTAGRPGAALAALLSGECDILDRTNGLQDESELLLELQAEGQINASFLLALSWEHADFGIQPVESYERPDLFGDVRTRRAIAHCMDRQAVVDTLSAGQTVVMDTYLPPNHPLYNPDVAVYDFDVAKGSALLEEVGWVDDDAPATPRVARGVAGVPEGTPLEFTYLTTTTNQRQEVAQILQASLAECGVKLNLEYRNPPQFFAEPPESQVWGRRFDMVQFSWSYGPVPGCNLYVTRTIPGDPEALDETGQPKYPLGWWGNNNTGFSDPEFDAACDTAMNLIPGTPAYARHHLEAQRIWAEQLPSVPLYSRIIVTATRPDLTGYRVESTDFTGFASIEEFDIVD